MTIAQFKGVVEPSEIVSALNSLVNSINNSVAIQTVGTWTPTFFGDGTHGTPTYVLQSGSYELTGRLVTARFIIYASAIGGMTGNLFVGGLPFISNDGTEGGVCIITQFQGWTGGAGYQYLGGSIANGTTSVIIGENGSSKVSQQVPITELSAPLIVIGYCNYHI